MFDETAEHVAEFEMSDIFNQTFLSHGSRRFDPAADQKFSHTLMQSSEVERKGNYLDLKKEQNFNSSIL